MQNFQEKVRAATLAALDQLGLSEANNPDTYDALFDVIGGIAHNVVTSDYDPED